MLMKVASVALSAVAGIVCWPGGTFSSPRAMAVSETPPVSDQKGNSSVDVAVAGKQLHDQILARYKQLNLELALRYGPPWNDISAVVAPFISTGMSFDDAEALLKAAGFVILPPPSMNTPASPTRNKDWYGLLTRMELPKRFLSRSTAYVTLFPSIPGEYTVVARFDASILSSTL